MGIFEKSVNTVWTDEGDDLFEPKRTREDANRIFMHYSSILSEMPHREERDAVRQDMREDEDFILNAKLILDEFVREGADYINATIRVEAKYAIRNGLKLIEEKRKRRQIEKEREEQELQAQMKDNPIFGMF